jgi:hypothetical protein
MHLSDVMLLQGEGGAHLNAETKIDVSSHNPTKATHP